MLWCDEERGVVVVASVITHRSMRGGEVEVLCVGCFDVSCPLFQKVGIFTVLVVVVSRLQHSSFIDDVSQPVGRSVRS